MKNNLALKRSSILTKELSRNYQLYLMILPAIIIVFIFNYIPMYGVQLAFKDYVVSKGIWGSEWVGLKHIKRFINSPYSWKLMWNTLSLNLYGFLGFPVPIIIALILNEITSKYYKRTIQTIICAPNFISTVVMVGIIFLFTNESKGAINNILEILGFKRIAFMAEEKWFRTVYVVSGIWQGAGWSSILYVSALSGVDQGIHEAAIIDGANRLQRIWHVDLASIKPTIVITMLMSLGSMLGVGFEKVYMMQLPLNLDVSEVIATYTYKIAFEGGSFSYSTAIGLFLNIVNLILLTLFNYIAKRTTDTSLW